MVNSDYGVRDFLKRCHILGQQFVEQRGNVETKNINECFKVI